MEDSIEADYLSFASTVFLYIMYHVSLQAFTTHVCMCIALVTSVPWSAKLSVLLGSKNRSIYSELAQVRNWIDLHCIYLAKLHGARMKYT